MRISRIELVQGAWEVSSKYSLENGDIIEDKGNFIKITTKENKTYLIPLSNVKVMEVLEDKPVETVKEKPVKKVKDPSESVKPLEKW